MNFLSEIFIKILWNLGLIHVPEWDNAKNPFKAPVVDDLKKPAVSIPDTKTMRYGVAEPGKIQKTVQIVETVDDDGQGWDLARWDGSISLDFTNWTSADDYVCRKRGFNETDIKNYCLVKPYVLQRKTNAFIAEALGKGIRWVETYGAAGREMIKIRIEEHEQTLSPTAEAGEEAAI